MKLFFLVLFLHFPLIGQPDTLNTYFGLQYRSDDLRSTSDQTAEAALVSKAHWKKMDVLELRLGMGVRPFTCPCSFLSRTCNAFLSSISVCLDGGVVLHSFSNRFNLALKEDMGGLLREQLHGKTTKVHGGDGSIFLLHRQYMNCSWTFLLSLGYNLQARNLSTGIRHRPLSAMVDDRMTDIDHIDYKTYWHGPWIGWGAIYTLNCDWNFFGNLEYHRALWRSDSKFNAVERLSDRFCFENRTKLTQKGILNGFKLRLGTSYAIDACWKIVFGVRAELFEGKNGRDRSHAHQHLTSPAGITIGESKIDRSGKASLHWHSWAITGAVHYDF